jgi:hypothetical protein
MVFELLLVAAGATVEPSAAEKETARRLMDQGKTALAHHDFDGAVSAYTKASELVHVPTTTLALARAHLAAGHLVEARDAALDAARLPEKPGEPSAQPAARSSAHELEQQLKPRIPTVMVKIEHPREATLSLDGRKIALVLLEAPLAVNPGHHELVAHLPSGADVTKTFDASEGQVANVTLDLPVEVTPPPQAHVETPATHDTASTPPIVTPTHEPSNAPKVVFAIGMVLAGGGAAAGAIFGAMTFGAANNVKASCTGDRCSPTVAGQLQDARTFAILSDVGFITAGVGAVLAITGIALWPKKRHDVSVSLAPTGLLVTGSFR